MKIEKLSNNEDFKQIVELINDSRERAFRKINAELVALNYKIGKFVFEKVAKGSCGDKTVDELAAFIKSKLPELTGFTRRGLYRMKQFYETYSPDSECHKIWFETQKDNSRQIVSLSATQLQHTEDKEDKSMSALPTQLDTTADSVDIFLASVLQNITWTNHLEILSSTKHPEEKLFYLLMTVKEQWTKKELRRQFVLQKSKTNG